MSYRDSFPQLYERCNIRVIFTKKDVIQVALIMSSQHLPLSSQCLTLGSRKVCLLIPILIVGHANRRHCRVA
ncbi:MAG: hypothetical protein ACR5LA_10330 [Wolbachia sp.]